MPNTTRTANRPTSPRNLYFHGWAVAILTLCFSARAVDNVTQMGIKGDGKTDDTAAVQRLLDRGASSLLFPHGIYRLGTVFVPSNTELRFSPGAVVRVNPLQLKGKRLLVLTGGNVRIEGPSFDVTVETGKPFEPATLETLVYGKGLANLRITQLHAVLPAVPDCRKAGLAVLRFENCHDIEVAHCTVANVHSLVRTSFCTNLSVHENRAESCQYMTLFENGCEGLRHYANWSRRVTFQCQWWGGDANDTHGWVAGNTARVIYRGRKPGDPGYDPNTAGAYDVSVQNNYAEYGTCLAWGSKGRDVIFDGNTARFMADMAYDVEGCENVIFSDNIAINSNAAGIGCYFWTDKVLITGNLVQVLDEGDAKYKGDFVRLQCPGEDPDHFGTGQALISGNLFVSELKDKVPRINVEACRDVTIAGNKFTNGRITTINNSRYVTIANNDFVCNLVSPYSCVSVGGGGARQDTITGNTFRRTVAGNDGGKNQAAIVTVGSNYNYPVLHRVESNSVDGWPHAIACTSRAKNKKPRFIIRNNAVTGDIRLIGPVASYRKFVDGNLDMTTLQPITPLLCELGKATR